MMRAVLTFSLAVGALFLVNQCTLINDLDRFQYACEGDISQTRDFTAIITGLPMADIGDGRRVDRLEARIVNSDREVVARGIVYGRNAALEGDTTRIFMPNAIPPGEHMVHLFFKRQGFGADVEFNPGTDRSWIREMCPSGLFEFEADDVLQPLDDPPTENVGNAFAIEMQGMHPPHTTGNQKLELRLIDDGRDTTVGYIRIAGFSDNTIFLGIPGQAIQNRRYRIDFYVDFNQNGIYDGHPTDHSWRLVETAGPLGLFRVSPNAWVHDTNFVTVDF